MGLRRSHLDGSAPAASGGCASGEATLVPWPGSRRGPPHRRAWLCIHRYEGSWRDSGDPYWGGLQMDRGFMHSYSRA